MRKLAPLMICPNKETTSVFYKSDPCSYKFTQYNKSIYKFQLLASDLHLQVGHLHDDVIWLQLPECISLHSLFHARVILHKKKKYRIQ